MKCEKNLDQTIKILETQTHEVTSVVKESFNNKSIQTKSPDCFLKSSPNWMSFFVNDKTQSHSLDIQQRQLPRFFGLQKTGLKEYFDKENSVDNFSLQVWK